MCPSPLLQLPPPPAAHQLPGRATRRRGRCTLALCATLAVIACGSPESTPPPLNPPVTPGEDPPGQELPTPAVLEPGQTSLLGVPPGSAAPSSASPSCVPAGTSAPARALIEKARTANGIETVVLFGVDRMLDFSQFTPRGHYTEAPLAQYFQAMMWLGRVDFRLIETLSDGSSAFRREQYEAVLAVHQLMEGRSSELWSGIDTVVRSFVGESDSMTVPEVASLIADLGGLDAARQATATAVASAISAGGYGEQQIASHLMVNDGTVSPRRAVAICLVIDDDDRLIEPPG